MKLAITIVEEASKQAPLVLRGKYVESIHQAAKIGYDAVELHLADPAELNVQEIKEVCKAAGVSVSSIGTGLAFVRDGLTLTHRDDAIRQQAIARLQAFIRLGSELGSVVIVGLIKGLVKDTVRDTIKPPVPDTIDNSAYAKYLTEALDSCLPTAGQGGVAMVLEAVNRYESDTLNTIGECVRFIERFDSEHLKLHIDTFHMNIEEDRIAANILAAGRHLGHVHVADSQRGYPGSGHYNFAETMAALKTIGYQGALSVECMGVPTPDEAALRAYQFLHHAVEL